MFRCSDFKTVFVAEPFSWINTIPEHVRCRRLAEKELGRLAQTLGNDWTLVAFEMGLSQVDVDHSKMEYNMNPVMQIHSALQKWRTRKPQSCTLNNFVNIVKDCQATTVDWAKMHKFATEM